MQQQIEKNENFCPRTEIAAYIDGELSSREEMDLEFHFAVCGECAAVFNGQKKLLCAIDFALDEKADFELPADFTKKVVVNAESNVSGLRRREERLRAMYLCGILFLLIIAGLGNETGAVFSTFKMFAEQIFAVGSFAAHLIFDFAVTLTTILRIIGGQFIYSPVFGILAFGAFLIFSGYVFLRILALFDRSKNLETR
ncbi:MAG: zf-HC2 domain-containing protein [Pyrinomonadaceae bacterium]